MQNRSLGLDGTKETWTTIFSTERIDILQTKKYRAPHKPLLLLLALARVCAGEPRLASYETFEVPLKRLLLNFGPPRKVLHPEHPFGHLRRDNLWDIPGGDRLPTRKGSIPRKELIQTQGGFPKQIYELLQNNRRLVRLAAQLLLDGHFPPSLHDDILAAAGMGSILHTAEGLEEDREFKVKIFQAYDRRCAICDLDLRINDEPVDLDAAHVARPARPQLRLERACVARASPQGFRQGRARPQARPRRLRGDGVEPRRRAKPAAVSAPSKQAGHSSRKRLRRTPISWVGTAARFFALRIWVVGNFHDCRRSSPSETIKGSFAFPGPTTCCLRFQATTTAPSGCQSRRRPEKSGGRAQGLVRKPAYQVLDPNRQVAMMKRFGVDRHSGGRGIER